MAASLRYGLEHLSMSSPGAGLLYLAKYFPRSTLPNADSDGYLKMQIFLRFTMKLTRKFLSDTSSSSVASLIPIPFFFFFFFFAMP